MMPLLLDDAPHGNRGQKSTLGVEGNYTAAAADHYRGDKSMAGKSNHKNQASVKILPATRQSLAQPGTAFKIASLAALVACGTLILLLPPVREHLCRLYTTGVVRLTALGWTGPLVFCAGMAVLVAIGVPRLLLYPVGGLAFGFWQGLLWGQIGNMLGAYATFLFVRWSGRDYIVRTWPRLRGYTEFFQQQGMLSVLLIRQIPCSGFYINILLGLTSVSYFDFFLGTFLGCLPLSVPATLAGAGAAALSSGEKNLYAFLAFATAATLWLLGARLAGAFLKSKKTKNILASPAEHSAEFS